MECSKSATYICPIKQQQKYIQMKKVFYKGFEIKKVAGVWNAFVADNVTIQDTNLKSIKNRLTELTR